MSRILRRLELGGRVRKRKAKTDEGSLDEEGVKYEAEATEEANSRKKKGAKVEPTA